MSVVYLGKAYRVTADLFFEAYKNGQRHFTELNFEDLEGFSGKDFSNTIFEKCFLYLDFRFGNLTNSQFINCNLKGIDLRYTDLTNALILNCSVDSAMFKGAKIDGFRFIDNHFHSSILSQDHFTNHLLDSDSHIQRKKRLSDIDFKGTLYPGVYEITTPVDLKTYFWSFANELVYEKILDEAVVRSRSVIKVYRNKLNWCDHVLIQGRNDTQVIIIVDRENPEVIGFYQPEPGIVYYP